MAVKIRDDLGRDVVLYRPPRRVVSLVPSDTETVFSLGCGDRLVGRTRYCVEPDEAVAAIPEVGGTKDTDVEAVLALQPELVIANQEENARGPLERLAQRGANVFVSLPRRVADSVAHTARVARLLGVEREPAVVERVRAGYAAVREAEEARAHITEVAAFLPIWMQPLMTLGGDTYASDLLALCGARNVFADRVRRYPLAADLGKVEPLPEEKVAGRDTRYPRITLDEVVERAPELVLLPDEPHPFTEDDARVFREQSTPAAARGAIAFADGKDLFWYGARTADALRRVRALVDRFRG